MVDGIEESVAAAGKAARRAETAAAAAGPRLEAIAGDVTRQGEEVRRVREQVKHGQTFL